MISLLIVEHITSIQNGLISETLAHRKISSQRRSGVWVKFHEVYKVETNEPVPFHFICTNCETLVISAYVDGNTTVFNRHSCDTIDHLKDNKSNIKDNSKNNKSKEFSVEEKNSLKMACADFVSKDLRPYLAVEGEGLLELCGACMEFGQRNRKVQFTIKYYYFNKI